MPTFNYVSGNISNLTGGGAANMADLQGPLTDVKTALNGNLDEINVPNLTAAFTTPKRLPERGVLQVSGGQPANTFAMTVTTVHGLVDLDPTVFAANARTTKLNLRLRATVNAVAPAVTFTAGLYPIATYGGAAGAGPSILTLGTVVSGSTVAIGSPLAAATVGAASGDFNFPSAGAYMLGVVTSGTTAASSVTDLIAHLDVRQV
jgi:hypothetical protein